MCNLHVVNAGHAANCRYSIAAIVAAAAANDDTIRPIDVLLLFYAANIFNSTPIRQLHVNLRCV